MLASDGATSMLDHDASSPGVVSPVGTKVLPSSVLLKMWCSLVPASATPAYSVAPLASLVTDGENLAPRLVASNTQPSRRILRPSKVVASSEPFDEIT